jgi:hypothetical protein
MSLYDQELRQKAEITFVGADSHLNALSLKIISSNEDDSLYMNDAS